MKTRYFKYISLFLAGTFALSSCEFLTRDDETAQTSGNYYTLQGNMEAALVGVYDVLGQQWGEAGGGNCPWGLWSDVMSDDEYAGGENSLTKASGEYEMSSHDIKPTTSQIHGFWLINYKGVNRANVILQNIDNVENWESDAVKNSVVGQAKFLRAFFYFRLVRMFGNIPLITTTVKDGSAYTVQDYKEVQQVEPDKVYELIFSDLESAITTLDTLDFSVTPEKAGRASKYAAEALYARAFLYYTGYYGKTELASVGATKDKALGYINDIINSGKFDLEANYGDNFLLSHEYGIESIFEISHMYKGADWGNGYMSEGNMQSLMMGPRFLDDKHALYSRGWSYGQVTQDLYDSYDPADPRRSVCAITVEELAALDPKFTLSDKTFEQGFQHTGIFNIKYTTKRKVNPDTGKADQEIDENTYGGAIEGTIGDPQVCNQENERIIRYADVLLMEAELTESADNLNKVRQRAGLADVAYSKEALFNERRLEFAGEGLRYWDLLRSTGAGVNIANATIAYDRITDAKAKKGSRYTSDDVYEVGDINPLKAGLAPIPQKEMDGVNGRYKQNPGY